ncbi:MULTISPECIES: RNA polymerase sigma factor [unclassified Paenibacillus]|uniref:RNA polymerase sigma factor n=1 Tax=unclassified Paenibacillus TaxID=185978 RepID=UPI000412CBC0|nr:MULTISPECIES: RNA polymerase sigma factor [unclassified Paenibacillus]KGP80644.1 RNA polymerase subunit sigma-24 [Paenibacillus sp. MAEPY2]KGP88479.1 RNA polymerase subunit sigma-24 [Paenibacillus sp. MAEPY1]
MSGAHDTKPVYPDEQESITIFENTYEQYRQRISKYFSLKLNPLVADDLTQQVFLKAVENIHSFKGSSNLFTWIFKIAQNTVKNEYRRLSRQKESPYDFTDYESQSISLEFTKHVDIRIDIGSALKKLDEIDQEIIALRFFVDCTLPEISKIVGRRESAVKNRLYRALEKLRKELKEWGDIAIMSIQDLISIVNKGVSHETNDRTKKMHQDLFDELNNSVERVSAKYKHHPSQKVVIEIYPDLPTFHQAVGETDAPNWFMGTYEGRILKIVSPLNPGPEHTYQSILKGTVHLFAMWLISDINPAAPKWIRQGIGGYEAKQMSQDFIKGSTEDSIRNQTIPSFDELNNDTWDFETMKGFQFSYMMVEFVVERYGIEALNKLIRNPQDFEGIFQCTKSELYKLWVEYIKI